MSDRDEMRDSYADTDPDVREKAQRKAQAELRRQNAYNAQKRLDAENLINDIKFIRFLFTEGERAGIFTPILHAQEGSAAAANAIRAFWLAMISDLEAIDPGIWVRITNERTKTLEKMNRDDSHREHR